jgi:hypothetical protein
MLACWNTPLNVTNALASSPASGLKPGNGKNTGFAHVVKKNVST